MYKQASRNFFMSTCTCTCRLMEQDPSELYSSVNECMEGVAEEMEEKGLEVSAIKGIGITNQRESTIMWDKTRSVSVMRLVSHYYFFLGINRVYYMLVLHGYLCSMV